MMTPIRKTSEGILVTTGSVKFASSAIALIGSLLLGAFAATRFIMRIGDVPTRIEFDKHVEKDSIIHAEQTRHSAFTDSTLSAVVRDSHGTICFVYRNPKPFCDDQPRRLP